jgi:NADH-quinone oxidoreductase subunit J
MSGLTCLCALTVVFSRDIVRMAVWLLFTLFFVGGLFFLLNAAFVAAVQLLVYVGGTLVLVIFGVVLTAKDPLMKVEASSGEWVTSFVVGLLLLAIVTSCIFTTGWTIDTIHLAELAKGVDVSDDAGPTLIGQALVTKYLLPFEIVSVHLVVVLVGAAYLARARGRKQPLVPPPPGESAGGES